MQFLNTSKQWVVVLGVLLALSFGVNANEKRYQSTALNSPEEVIENYFTALQSGDTVEIRKLLGGNLLKSRARLLTNPTYPLTLQEWYRDTNFAITGTTITGADTVNIEASASKNNTQLVKYSFTLTKDNNDEFHITDETEIL